MTRTSIIVLAVVAGVAAVAVAALVWVPRADQPSAEEPAQVENTRPPGQVLEEWDSERRQNAEPH